MTAQPESRRARIAERLLATGVPLPTPEAVAFAIDFLRLLVQVAVPSSDLMAARRGALVGVLERRTALSPAAARELLRIVEAPEFRSGLPPRDLEAFVARFGSKAGQVLVASAAVDVDLAAFGPTYGGDQALLLLDSIFAVLTVDEDVDRDELRRLEECADALGIDAVLFTALLQKHDRDLARGQWTVKAKRPLLTLGRSLACEVLLPDPQVAGVHATLVYSDTGWRVQDAKSGRPTVVNGRPVNAAPLGPGDELRVGPFVVKVDAEGKEVFVEASRAFATLSVSHLTRQIGKISLLDDVSFTVFSGEVVAMIGPSGCGKTTLLNAIAGVTPADSGTVRLDGRDFHTELREERESVGIVPQDDIVHPELTVEESLYFGAKLRLPVGTGDDAVRGEVDRVLEELGIEHIRGSRIGDALRRGISGGQRKRVNLGQELLARTTRVLFLDEPTSGLDPRASQDIVRLVRQIADRGRIVFVVTHDLSAQVVAQVDHLLVLAPGGRVAFFGPPAEACKFFGVETPDAIFNQFSGRDPRELGEAWKTSADARTYVAMREQLLKLRADEGRVPGPPPAARKRRRSGWVQTYTLVRRYLKVKRRDLGGLAVLLMQAPILALVMKIVFPHPTREMLFMLSLSCLWFGMSAAVRELISDRVIWLRERRIGVRPGPYVWSKTYVLGGLVTVQCAVFALLNLALHAEFLREYGFGLLDFTGICALTGFVGMSLGLLVSAVNVSSEGAVGTLPLLLIPQIAFSGILLSLRRMPALARELAWWNPARFAYDALIKTGERLGAPQSRGMDWDAMPLNGTLYNLGFKGDGADDFGLSMPQLVGRLALFSVLFLLGALGSVQRRRE
ncbi:MAG: ATP-binding cassette domain-containing protein [Deltaproteobacteria bacterium]|nr:ATP-binding cassette domain-containing protein [Deltaproteobacteria bacterium]